MAAHRDDGEPDTICRIPLFSGRGSNLYHGLHHGKTFPSHEKVFGAIRAEAGTDADDITICIFYIGMAYTTGTKGSVINAANAFVSILAAPLLIKGEKLTWKQGAGCVIGFLGVVIINLEPGAWGNGFSLKGEGMVLICTVIYGISTVIMKKISHMESAMTITAYQLLFGGFIIMAAGFVAGGHIEGFDGKSLALLIYMAMLSAVAFSVWTILLKYNTVGKVAIFGFSIPIFGVFLSAVILKEQIVSLKNLAALVCVSIGILIVNGMEMPNIKEKKQVS